MHLCMCVFVFLSEVILTIAQLRPTDGVPTSCQAVLSNGIGQGFCFPRGVCQLFPMNLPQGNCTTESCCFITMLDEIQCGVKGQSAVPISPRIIGGRLVGTNEFCWQATIFDNRTGGIIGGGSLIRPDWVVTSAVNVAGRSNNTLRLRLGISDLTEVNNPCTISRNVSQIIIHPAFSNSSDQFYLNNIALLRLDTSVDVTSDCVCLVCLPRNQQNISGQVCTISGFGSTTGSGDSSSNVLRAVDLRIKSREQCESVIQSVVPNFNFHPSFLCAGDLPGRDACTGDGGGPLVCRDGNGLYYQAGISSWGIGCAEGGVPGIYTNLFLFTSWIEQNIVARALF